MMKVQCLVLLMLTVSTVASSVGRATDTIGACCFGNGFCTPQTQATCESVAGQVYQGDGTVCVGDFTCPVVLWSCVCVDGVGNSAQSGIGCVSE